MGKSLNGFQAPASSLRTITIPGTKRQVTLATFCAPVFAAFLADWHNEMPKRLKLDHGMIGGNYYREARLGQGISNHGSGTAVDVHNDDVLFADNKRHMTDKERVILKRILARYVTTDGHHIFANGAFWNHVDEMHTELSQGWDVGAKRYTTAADVAEVIHLLGIDKNGNRRGFKPVTAA